MKTQSLAGQWQFRQAGQTEWLPAQVPGGVHTDLLAAGKIPDPFVADNELRVQWIPERAWEYDLIFDVPTDLLAGERLFLVCDGLKGLPDAIGATWELTQVQTCIIHLIRNTFRYAARQHWEKMAKDLRPIYTAPNIEAAEQALTAFEGSWDEKYPMISESWRERWDLITPFLALPADLRKIVYTTNSIEALNRQIRKTIKTRGHFPTQDAASKLIYLAITRAENGWRNVHGWTRARTALKIHFKDRMPDNP